MEFDLTFASIKAMERFHGRILSVQSQRGGSSAVGQNVVLTSVAAATKRSKARIYFVRDGEEVESPHAKPKELLGHDAPRHDLDEGQNGHEAPQLEQPPELEEGQPAMDEALEADELQKPMELDELHKPAEHVELSKPAELDLPESPNRKSFAEKENSLGTWEGQVPHVLSMLEPHSKFKQRVLRSRRRFFHNIFLSCRLALWMVILAGPVIVWPVAEFFNSWGQRSSKYMASYAMAMSNFCFLLSPNIGMGIRYAIEGVVGTLLALANMLLLNQVRCVACRSHALEANFGAQTPYSARKSAPVRPLDPGCVAAPMPRGRPSPTQP